MSSRAMYSAAVRKNWESEVLTKLWALDQNKSKIIDGTALGNSNQDLMAHFFQNARVEIRNSRSIKLSD